MNRTARERLRPFLMMALGAGMFLALAASLPGELRGCGGDTSGSVNKAEYCRDKCDIEAKKIRMCGLVEDTDDAEEELYIECVRARQCDNSSLCFDVPNYHISNEEADACFMAIGRLDCGGIVLDGLTYTYETPSACEDICDPI